MPNSRRQLLRPPVSRTSPLLDCHRRMHQVRTRLAQERAALRRWSQRLKRAFHALEKHERRVCRLEQQLAKQEEPCHAARQ
jgi:hypothetical protein